MLGDDLSGTALLEGLVRQRRTIVIADAVESVRLMGQDEPGFIAAWRAFVQHVRAEILPAHGGTLVKSLGDGLLLRFDTPTAAVAAALKLVGGTDIQLRVGVHTAEVVMDELDIYGSGVNLAARLSTLAEPSQVIVSSEVRDALADGVDAELVDLGECYLKHVDGPVRAFVLRPPKPGISVSRDSSSLPPTQLAATVAIVPFECVADSGVGQAIGIALADTVIARLCRLPGLCLVARLSTATIARASNVVEACRLHLGAHYVVSGTCISVAGWARGIASVIDARTSATIWTDAFAIRLDALFQDGDDALAEMVQGICNSLCSHTVQRARGMPMPNLESFALYLGGVTLLHRLGRNDFVRSHDLLSALKGRHPRAAAPQAMLAKWHMFRVLQGWSTEPREEGRRGLEMAVAALDKEPDHPIALSMAGLLGIHFGDGLDSARAMAERAVQTDPQEPSAWMTLAGIESYLGRGAESAAHARRAILLSPLDPCRFLFELMLGAGELADGRLEDAISSVQASMRLNAVHAPTYRLAVIANMLAGRNEAAKQAASRLLVLDPGFRVRDFANRYPGRDQPHAPNYVRALRDAGLPD